jgi:hypothetical protein
VDQLTDWHSFFKREQMLVLQSERFFERPRETLDLVLDFVGLPGRKLDSKGPKTKRPYERMNPPTRRRLEEYFEPHNKRLYDYLGVDYDW